VIGIAGEHTIVTAGGIDTHIHFICPQLFKKAIIVMGADDRIGQSDILDRPALSCGKREELCSQLSSPLLICWLPSQSTLEDEQ
jgi:hypothetical protein